VSRTKDICIKRITFEQIVDYWKNVSHFSDMNKQYVSTVGYLGHFTRTIKKPHFYCYGLFIDGDLVGATHISEWSEGWVRYRTINIREKYRGQNLGFRLLCSCIQKDWSQYKTVFGWVKRDHVNWSISNGFSFIDNVWQDDHTGMSAQIDYFSENIKLISFIE
jgi:hypothetical protein